MKAAFVFALLLVAAAAVSAAKPNAASPSSPKWGGKKGHGDWTKAPVDAATTALAKDAVAAINKDGKATLTFSKLVAVKTETVASGTKYRLKIAVTDAAGTPATYIAAVLVPAAGGSAKLLRYKDAAEIKSSPKWGGGQVKGGDWTSGKKIVGENGANFKKLKSSPKPYKMGGSGGMPGGLSDANTADPQVAAAAAFAVSALNTKADVAGKPLKLGKVLSAKTQVVAGTNYFLVLSLKGAAGATSVYKVQVFKPLPFAATNGAGYELTKYAKKA